RFRGQVFGLCFQLLRHRQDAEDIAQESFVRVLRSLKQWDQTREFLPWLLAIAGNRCRTLLSSRLRRPVALGFVERLPDPRGDAESAGPLEEEIERALGHLRPEYRQAFTLFHEQELSYLEISSA